MIDIRATHCPHCTGDIRTCPKDGRVAVKIINQWKGVLRGGRQQVVTCARCGQVLEGSKW
jgi:hypothetical protein